MDGRMGTSYSDMLARQTAAAALSSDPVGSSGYFSKPSDDLDPRLFVPHTGKMHPAVRRWILTTILSFWEAKFRHPQRWARVWVAGSGITTQWSGGRAIGDVPGDLDVLIGVDWPTFFHSNPEWVGSSDADVAELINQQLHSELWPRTAAAVMPGGGAPFEVTFYVNATGSDIRDINPYAAYDVTDDAWTVRPIELPPDWDPQTFFDTGWWEQVHREAATARELLGVYRLQRERLLAETDHARQLNALAQIHSTVLSASSLFDSIHVQRRQAFAPGGAGFLDYYNFRWQAGKYLGTVASLKELAALHSNSVRETEAVLYRGGAPMDTASAITAAIRAVAQERS